MRTLKGLALLACLGMVTFSFQNCAMKGADGFKTSKNDQSSILDDQGPGPSPLPAPTPLPVGDPTAADIQDVRIVPGEKANILIVFNSIPQRDMVFTYSTADDSAVAGTHYIGVQNASGGIFAGSVSAQIAIDSTNTAALSYLGKSFKVAVNFPSKPELNKVVRVSFSAAPSGVGLKDKWAAYPASALSPGQRYYHTAVWTGSKMIVFGGYNAAATIQNNGKSYDAASDTWIDINVTGGPGPRGNHTAVWTGNKMIVWGGQVDNAGNAPVNTGMSYDPATNMWSAVSAVNAPSARWGHVAVWTGSKMIIWGGWNGTLALGDGGIYDPATNTWTAIAAAPGAYARSSARAVWTGTKMVVFGGHNGAVYLNDGKLFDPATNTWTDMSLTGAPAARGYHAAVWTGSKMLVYGGWNGAVLANGGIYDPATNTWSAMNATGAASARYGLSGVWTGSSMLLYGGYNNGAVYADGGIYY